MKDSTLDTWKKLQEEGYFENHSLYDCKSTGIPHCVEMKEIVHKNVLDFGCGYGRDSLFFVLFANKVHCVDVSDTILNKARNFIGFGVDNVEYVLSEKINEIPDNSLDYIYSLHVFQHLAPKQAEEYIKIFRKKLKKGGRLNIQFFIGNDKIMNKNTEPRVQYTMEETQGLYNKFRIDKVWMLDKFNKKEEHQYKHCYVIGVKE